jgi:hypothetical protein
VGVRSDPSLHSPEPWPARLALCAAALQTAQGPAHCRSRTAHACMDTPLASQVQPKRIPSSSSSSSSESSRTHQWLASGMYARSGEERCAHSQRGR